MHTRDLTIVTNTYPVFKRSMNDNENGIYLSKTLSEIKKNSYMTTKEYMDDFNLALNKFVKDCYDSASETDDYYRYEGSGPNEHLRYYKIDDGYYLLVMQSDPYTILLNYEKADGTDIIMKIPRVSNYAIHVRELEQGDKTYKVINTYNAFLNYTSTYGIHQNLGANGPFFKCFFDSIKEVDLSKRYGRTRRALDVNKPMTGNEYNHFYYVVEEDKQNDIVIIADYGASALKLKND